MKKKITKTRHATKKPAKKKCAKKIRKPPAPDNPVICKRKSQ